MSQPTILLVEQDQALRHTLNALLCRKGFDVIEASAQADLVQIVQMRHPNLVIVNASLGGVRDGLEAARQIRRRDQRLPLILLTATSSEDLAIAALRAGFDDYLKLPVPPEELAASISRCLSASPQARPPTAPEPVGRPLIGQSGRMREIRVAVAQVAPTDSTVLLTGETGTGKELVAELIHRSSPRRLKPFVCITCTAIPETLFESELFGYERGAFTGAYAPKEGALARAEGGTAFFDEIGDMSPHAQSKILRAIETKEVSRLGGRRSVAVDARVIAATNQDLERLVSEDRFRKDLYFRLNVARIHLPPLRDRMEDIPILLDHYIEHSNRRFGRDVEGVTRETLEWLLRYPWPGNVRELKNLIEAIFVSSPSRRISFTDLPDHFRGRLKEAQGLPQGEREGLLAALFSTNWNKSRAAQQLRWSRMTVYRKMAKYQISRPRTVTSPPSDVTGP